MLNRRLDLSGGIGGWTPGSGSGALRGNGGIAYVREHGDDDDNDDDDDDDEGERKVYSSFVFHVCRHCIRWLCIKAGWWA